MNLGHVELQILREGPLENSFKKFSYLRRSRWCHRGLILPRAQLPDPLSKRNSQLLLQGSRWKPLEIHHGLHTQRFQAFRRPGANACRDKDMGMALSRLRGPWDGS